MVAKQHLVLATVMVAVARGASAQALPVDDPVRLAIRLCDEAGHFDGQAREDLLARALTLATAGVDADPQRADAHYAVFCVRGRQLDGHGVSMRSVLAARRLRRAIDRVLEIDPDHVDGLVGKATMFLRIPLWLGGDPEEARRCLERVRALAPEHPALPSLSPQVRSAAVGAVSR